MASLSRLIAALEVSVPTCITLSTALTVLHQETRLEIVAQHIAHETPDIERSVAIAVIEVLVSVRRPPLIEELMELLAMENEEINFSPHTQIFCAGLIKMKDDSTVQVIDDTVKDLLTDVSSPLRIRKERADAKLAANLLRELISTAWSPQTTYDRSSGLLHYAACSWPYRLVANENLIDAFDLQLLRDFLASEHLLRRIEMLAQQDMSLGLESAFLAISWTTHTVKAKSPEVARMLALSAADLSMIPSQHSHTLSHRQRVICTTTFKVWDIISGGPSRKIWSAPVIWRDFDRDQACEGQ